LSQKKIRGECGEREDTEDEGTGRVPSGGGNEAQDSEDDADDKDEDS
jgi:hypothetical protein